MEKVNVKILMDNRSSTVNKKLLGFLMNVVNEYKNNLFMSISLISRENRDAVDSAITSLPASYIGERLILGYENIMEGIDSAYKNAKMRVTESDPIQSFWENTMKDGMDEKQKNAGDVIASKFTEATKQRNNVISRNSGKFKNAGGGKAKPGSDDDEEDPAPRRSKAKMPSGGAPKNTAEMIQKNNNKYDYGDDPSKLNTDPDMQAFWDNSFQTDCD